MGWVVNSLVLLVYRGHKQNPTWGWEESPQGKSHRHRWRWLSSITWLTPKGYRQGADSAFYEHHLWCRFCDIFYHSTPFDMCEYGDHCLLNFKVHKNYLGSLLTKHILGSHPLKLWPLVQLTLTHMVCGWHSEKKAWTLHALCGEQMSRGRPWAKWEEEGIWIKGSLDMNAGALTSWPWNNDIISLF